MARLDETAELCHEVHRLRDQLASFEAVVAGTIRVSTELLREIKRVRQDTEHLHRWRAERYESIGPSGSRLQAGVGSSRAVGG